MILYYLAAEPDDEFLIVLPIWIARDAGSLVPAHLVFATKSIHGMIVPRGLFNNSPA